MACLCVGLWLCTACADSDCSFYQKKRDHAFSFHCFRWGCRFLMVWKKRNLQSRERPKWEMLPIYQNVIFEVRDCMNVHARGATIFDICHVVWWDQGGAIGASNLLLAVDSFLKVPRKFWIVSVQEWIKIENYVKPCSFDHSTAFEHNMILSCCSIHMIIYLWVYDFLTMNKETSFAILQ